jgi:hypothetical protein
MSTGNVTSWDGNVVDIGPLYPFVGSEGLLVLVLVALWVVWHGAQMVGENRELEDRVRQLRQAGALQKALDSEHPIERM